MGASLTQKQEKRRKGQSKCLCLWFCNGIGDRMGISKTKQTNKRYGWITNSKARKEKEGGKQNVCVCGFAMEGGSRPKAS